MFQNSKKTTLDTIVSVLYSKILFKNILAQKDTLVLNAYRGGKIHLYQLPLY